MLSIFLAILVHFMAPAYSSAGALGHAPVVPGHHAHAMDASGSPGG
jgi:hypothetical protein